MIYDIERRFAFIHIPRCAGLSVTKTIASVCPSAIVDIEAGRHRWAWQIAARMKRSNWEQSRAFATMRSPWEIVESDYCLTCNHVKMFDKVSKDWRSGWRARVHRLIDNPSFHSFVQREYLNPKFSGILHGGFWKTWCTTRDGQPMGIRIVPFKRLPHMWNEVCNWANIPFCKLQYINAAPFMSTLWSKELITAIGDLCFLDIERFGFKSPKVQV